MIKKDLTIINRGGINYQLADGKLIKYKPWLGDIVSFLYDPLMEKSIFPKKFDADIQRHFDFLKMQYKGIQNSRILEAACGSGSLSKLLPQENSYTGLDISPGLIRIAMRKFKAAGFKNPRFYASDVLKLPFADNTFDVCICNLSLNFFPDTALFINEIKRVLKTGGSFYCSVPVPERKPVNSVIRGTLLTAAELESGFTEVGFNFIKSDFENGAVFYFKAVK